MTLQLLYSTFPSIWGKFDFLFYQCSVYDAMTMRPRMFRPRTYFWDRRSHGGCVPWSMRPLDVASFMNDTFFARCTPWTVRPWPIWPDPGPQEQQYSLRLRYKSLKKRCQQILKKIKNPPKNIFKNLESFSNHKGSTEMVQKNSHLMTFLSVWFFTTSSLPNRLISESKSLPIFIVSVSM
jgi:hypothetical protein